MSCHHGSLRSALVVCWRQQRKRSRTDTLDGNGAETECTGLYPMMLLLLTNLAIRLGCSPHLQRRLRPPRDGSQGVAEGRRSRREGFVSVGVACVEFAVSCRTHFEVRFQPSLYRADNAEALAARAGRRAPSRRRGEEH
jgi:hypothetical protein